MNNIKKTFKNAIMTSKRRHHHSNGHQHQTFRASQEHRFGFDLAWAQRSGL
ncbi:hypothetical protein FB566_2753 [Stackebrandtia endophytica]|uniref:Uncharacterized protein n=1 Tax=Stackebrandtia endophytica TaxID=1496996 RepID=A0A543AX99_9ACTN|nr:hypothetical protein FB566_2753 [Stackebrandtia endophytica]